jgi:oligo-1,6-glucosidase
VISEPTQTHAVRIDRPTDWWKSAVVYQIYPRSFADSNGDGTGDIPGMLSHLDYLAELGVDVGLALAGVRLADGLTTATTSATTKTSTRSSEPLDDLDLLIAGLHDRGIKIVMDLVGQPHLRRASRGSSSREILPRPSATGTGGGRPGPGLRAGQRRARSRRTGSQPSRARLGSSMSAAGSTICTSSAPSSPDLNWENPEVRQAIYDMMNWWVDRGIDGFRMDVINLISKGQLVDGEPPPGRTRAHSFIFTANGPRLDEFLAEMNAAVGLDERNLLTVGEMPGSTVEVARRATDPANHELTMVFTFEHVRLDSRLDGGGNLILFRCCCQR